MMHWGQRSLTYTVSGTPYQVSLGAFFQVNRFLVPDLLRLAIGRSFGPGCVGSLFGGWAFCTGACI